MKKIFLGLTLIILLLSACTHSQVSGNGVVEAGNETVETAVGQNSTQTAEKLAADEKKEAERVEVEKKAEEELINLAKLKKAVNATVEKCSGFEDGYNSTFCFAEYGVNLMKQYGRIQDLHPVYTLCEYADDSNFCYFYAAVMLNGPGYCNKVKDKTGCELISDPLFCNRLINPNQCLLERATLIRIVNKPAAQMTCDMMQKFDKYPDAEKYNCAEIDFGEVSYDKESFKDRFFLMHFMTALMDFELYNTTLEDYNRNKRVDYEQD